MSNLVSQGSFPLVVPFRKESGYDTSRIQLRLVGNLNPYPVVGGSNSDILPLIEFERKDFDALGGDVVIREAFHSALETLKSGQPISQPTSSAERCAQQAITKHSLEIQRIFGVPCNNVGPMPSGACGC